MLQMSIAVAVRNLLLKKLALVIVMTQIVVMSFELDSALSSFLAATVILNDNF